MKVLRDFFSTTDGSGYELGRALWCLLTVGLTAYQGIDIFVNGNAFDPVEFGAGAAAILAAGGFGVATKDNARTKAVAA
jgi:hypothetical protein